MHEKYRKLQLESRTGKEFNVTKSLDAEIVLVTQKGTEIVKKNYLDTVSTAALFLKSQINLSPWDESEDHS